VKTTIWGSDELHPYPLRSSTYGNEQVRADEVQRVNVYTMDYQGCQAFDEK